MSFKFKVFLYLNQTFLNWIQGSFCSKDTFFEKSVLWHKNYRNFIWMSLMWAKIFRIFLSLSWNIFNQYYHSPYVASVHLLACKFYGFDNLHVGFFIFVIYYLSCQLSKQCRGAWSFCVRIDVLNAHPIKCGSRQDKKDKLNLSTSFKVSEKHFFKAENYIIYVHVSYL